MQDKHTWLAENILPKTVEVHKRKKNLAAVEYTKTLPMDAGHGTKFINKGSTKQFVLD